MSCNTSTMTMAAMCKIAVQHHIYLTTPYLVIDPFWSAPSTVHSLPVFLIIWVFPAHVSAKNFYFLRCIYILKV